MKLKHVSFQSYLLYAIIVKCTGTTVSPVARNLVSRKFIF